MSILIFVLLDKQVFNTYHLDGHMAIKTARTLQGG